MFDMRIIFWKTIILLLMHSLIGEFAYGDTDAPTITAGRFVEAFLREASGAGMTPAETSEVTDAWTCAGPVVAELKGRMGTADFRKSLVAFVKAAHTFRAPPIDSGGAYWLAFCAAEGFSRKPLDESMRHKIILDDKTINDECLRQIEKGLLDQVPSGKRGEIGKTIEGRLQEVRSRLATGVDGLSSNVLFPGLKRTLVNAEKERVLHEYKNTDMYPKYGRSDGNLMATPDEVYYRDLGGFFKNLVSNQLLNLAMPTFEWDLDKTPLWGRMQWSGVGTGLDEWPVWIEMRPLSSPITRAPQ